MKPLLLVLFSVLATCRVTGKNFPPVLSPDGLVKLTVMQHKGIFYKIFYRDKLIVDTSFPDLELAGGARLSHAKGYKKMSLRYVNEWIVSPVPEKRKNIPDQYRQLSITLTNSFSIIFRVYNDGIAYRIGTSFKDSIIIKNEIADFNFPAPHPVYYPQVKPGRTDIYHTSFEEPYLFNPINKIPDSALFFTPVLVAPEKGPKIAITESDLEDYPGMFLKACSGHHLSGNFAPYPAIETMNPGEYPQWVVSKRASFIAKTSGTRVFPWRVLIIAAADKQLPENDLVYRLASPSRIKDVSWIHPMQSTDEWIITENLFSVNFKSGINTATYKYYIDFAKSFGIESIMMDAGWSDNNDLFKINPHLDIEEIMSYAKSRNVKVNMWTLAATLDRQLEPALEQFNRWGVSFIMTDFFDRDDQKVVSLLKRITEACARHKLMIMFHGVFKPAGFNRTYPNAITREAVMGSEFNIWTSKVTPHHNLMLPFTRMLAGPMDYEPGLLDNANEKTFRPIEQKVMSNGTRCQQLAMYVVYESPVQFFSGNPSQGKLEPEFMQLLGSIPTVWDTTMVIDAKVGEYIITARKKDNAWYVGAMTDSSARSFTLPLGFLGEGNFEATICEDGINADRYASDYRLFTKQVSDRDSLKLNLQSGGGYVVRFFKK